MSKSINIVMVYRSGGDYHWPDVELLRFHVLRNCPEARLFILTDKVREAVAVDEYTMLIPLRDKFPGWWAKMELFRPELETIRPFLYMDLDTAVVGTLEPVIPERLEEWWTLQNVYYPGRIGSGLMWIPAGNKKIQRIWAEWVKDADKAMESRTGDQGFIERVCMPDRMWAEGILIQSVKPLPHKQLLPTIPDGCSIVYFHGRPRPRQAQTRIHWIAEYFRQAEAPQIATKWVISLPDRKDRLERFQNQAGMGSFLLFPGIKKVPGILGCNASHRAVLRQDIELPCLICEDDAEMVLEWKDVYAAMYELPRDWDVLYLGANLQSRTIRHSTRLRRLTGRTFMTHAIVWGSRRAVDYFIDNYKDTDTTPVDVWLSNNIIPRFNCFVMSPMAMLQAPSVSDIVGKPRDYAKEMKINYNKHTA